MEVENRDTEEVTASVDALRPHGTYIGGRMHTQDNAVAGRVKRGLALVDKVKRHGDLYIVAGNGGNYTVSLDNVNGETCECRDWRLHFERDGFGHICKHIVAVTIANARR